MPLIEIRIALDLFLHGAGRAVTGQQARLGRQAEDVMINALQQLLAAAPGRSVRPTPFRKIRSPVSTALAWDA